MKSNNYKEALTNSYSILSAMAMPDGFVRNEKYNSRTHTRYICSYDTKHKLLTIKSHANPAVYQVGFEDIEVDDKRQAFFLKEEFTAEKLV